MPYSKPHLPSALGTPSPSGRGQGEGERPNNREARPRRTPIPYLPSALSTPSPSGRGQGEGERPNNHEARPCRTPNPISPPHWALPLPPGKGRVRAKDPTTMKTDDATLQTLPVILRLARASRHPLTSAEAKVWARVRNRGLGYKIRRQHPIWRFIADFYCAEAKLVIEIDGDPHTHPDQASYDLARTLWLEERGYSVIRFSNEDVCSHLNAVLDELSAAIQPRVAQLDPINPDNTTPDTKPGR